MKTFFLLLIFVAFNLFSLSCKKTSPPTVGEHKYFFKVRVIGREDEGYEFILSDNKIDLLNTVDITNDLYLDKYKIIENIDVSLKVTDWDSQYLYWDSPEIIDENKEKRELSLVMDSDKLFRVLMSSTVNEKHFIDLEVAPNSGITVAVSDVSFERRYTNFFTNRGRIAFLKGMNIDVWATNANGLPISTWSVSDGTTTESQNKNVIEIRDVKADYRLIPNP